MHIAEAETEEKKTGCYRHTEMQRDLIIEKLKEKGLRITRQRKILLDIILEESAPVVRNLLQGFRTGSEDRCSYSIPYGQYAGIHWCYQPKEYVSRGMQHKGVCTVELDDDTICHLSGQKLNEVILAGLRACGEISEQNIRTLALLPVHEVG